MRGIVTSRIARSMSSESASSTASAPSPASATTSRSGSAVEHHLQAVAHDRVVVREQDACLQRRGHASSCSTGIVSRTSVP